MFFFLFILFLLREEKGLYRVQDGIFLQPGTVIVRGGKGRQRQRLRTASHFVGFGGFGGVFFFDQFPRSGVAPARRGKRADVNDRV